MASASLRTATGTFLWRLSNCMSLVKNQIAAWVADKVGRYHEQFGHEVIHLSADTDGVTVGQQRRSLELFQSDVAPVLRDRIPSRPLVAESNLKEVAL